MRDKIGMTEPQRPTQVLPGTYQLSANLNLAKDIKLAIALNIASLGMFAGSVLLSFKFLQLIRPSLFTDPSEGLFSGYLSGTFLVTIIILISVIVGMIFLHEAIHGLFFWLFTGGRPKFGFRGFYAYAAAPDWFIPKPAYLIISLAPLVVISVVGFGLMLILPPAWVLPILLLVTMNASGAVGDLYAFFWLLLKPKGLYIQDFGDRMAVYFPGEKAGDAEQE
jgi:hypothetical protein